MKKLILPFASVAALALAGPLSAQQTTPPAAGSVESQTGADVDTSISQSRPDRDRGADGAATTGSSAESKTMKRDKNKSERKSDGTSMSGGLDSGATVGGTMNAPMPRDTVPGSTMPDNTMPDNTVPGSTSGIDATTGAAGSATVQPGDPLGGR